MSFDRIIAITRQYGSGGHDIGKALDEKLGISFYDKELISIAAKESGVSPEVFKHADERATNSLLYSLSVGLYNYGNNFSSVGDRLMTVFIFYSTRLSSSLQKRKISLLSVDAPTMFLKIIRSL